MAPADGTVGEYVEEAGPGAATARSTLTLRSCQCVAAACATYGMWWAAAIAVMSFCCWALPQLSLPAGLVVVLAAKGVAPGALHAGVYVGVTALELIGTAP